MAAQCTLIFEMEGNMAAPATEHVRNIVLVGQDGAGKTSLAEAMLYVSGKTPRMGTTHDGKSFMDYDHIGRASCRERV